LLGLIEHEISSANALTLWALCAPVTSMTALDQKVACYRSGTHATNPELMPRLSEEAVPAALASPLSHEYLIRHTRYLARLHPFYEMRMALDRGEDEDDLRDVSAPSLEGYLTLRSALDGINVALAQQTLLTGDIFLPDLLEVWRDATAPREPNEEEDVYILRGKRAEILGTILDRNAALQSNLLIYAIRKSIKLNSLPAYQAAMAVPGEPHYLRQVLPQPMFDLVWDTQTSHHSVRIGTAQFPLPAAAQVVAGDILQSPGIKQLLAVRDELREEMSGYEIWGQLDEAAAETLKDAILPSASSPTFSPTSMEFFPAAFVERSASLERRSVDVAAGAVVVEEEFAAFSEPLARYQGRDLSDKSFVIFTSPPERHSV
jgi:hypothetical protein